MRHSPVSGAKNGSGDESRPPLRLRLRLTLFYGVLSVVSGVSLLAVTYLLIDGSGDVSAPLGQSRRAEVPPMPPLPPIRVVEESDGELFRLLVVCGIALAIMAVVSLVLGWLIAGRVLRPVRTMTETLRQISARNLHERLALTGSRNEIKDLADTIDGLLGRLQTALEGHQRFVANAAHELRTPLAVEHALLEEPLIDEHVTLESFRANFERLLKINEQRGRLLESLLTLSASEHVRDRYQPLDLGSLTERVLQRRAEEAERCRIQVDPTITPVRILGEPELIERLVTNLLDNALHHNQPGGWVEIGTRAEAGQAVLHVTNSGPSVPAAQVGRLVEPFQRLQRVADDGHHGLGLSIVSAIATAHDATLTVRSRMSGGLFVEVAFPAVRDPGPAAPEQLEPAGLAVGG